MAAAATATSPSASFPAASLRRDARRSSCVAAAAAATTAAEAGLAAVPAPPPTPMVRVVPESLQRESGCLVAGFRERDAGAADAEGFGDAAGEGGGPGAMEYLTSVLSSKVYDVAIESPLQLATKLSERLGVNLWIKREDLQPVIDGDAQPFVCLPPPPFFWLACVMDVDICVLLFQKTAPFLGDAGVQMFQLLLVFVG
jgi:threonine dehydratase